MPKKGGFGQFADLRGGGGLGKKEGGGVFEEGGVDTLMHTMIEMVSVAVFSLKAISFINPIVVFFCLMLSY